MERLIAPRDMLASEWRYFEESGVPSIEVMERAARALSDAVLRRYPRAGSVHIACGPGGNGGDGYACARMLHEAGLRCRVFAAAPAQSPDAVENARRAASLGIAPLDARALDAFGAPDVWVDALYGTGLSRAPSGSAAALIRRMNADRAAGAAVVAADIPSGLNGETGAAHDPCVAADCTVTFHLRKLGHLLGDGLDLCGALEVANVGFPGDIFPENLPLLFGPDDLRALFPRRPRNLHKGRCGHLLIVAGSVGMAGAAALCAQAALRGGAGLVTVACPEEIVPILQALAPCAMCAPLPAEGGALCARALPALAKLLEGKNAVAFGCGLSRRAAPELLEPVLACDLPAVIDADGLNLLSQSLALCAHLAPRHVLTPHPGEAARLLGRGCESPVSDARALAALGATAVLKGASRVLCDGARTLVSASGGCGMARGGSGDILTGLLGALLAEPSPRAPIESAAAACELHGLAGALAQAKYGPRAMQSADILEFLPEVFQRYVD